MANRKAPLVLEEQGLLGEGPRMLELDITASQRLSGEPPVKPPPLPVLSSSLIQEPPPPLSVSFFFLNVSSPGSLFSLQWLLVERVVIIK